MVSLVASNQEELLELREQIAKAERQRLRLIKGPIGRFRELKLRELEAEQQLIGRKAIR